MNLRSFYKDNKLIANCDFEYYESTGIYTEYIDYDFDGKTIKDDFTKNEDTDNNFWCNKFINKAKQQELGKQN